MQDDNGDDNLNFDHAASTLGKSDVLHTLPCSVWQDACRA